MRILLGQPAPSLLEAAVPRTDVLADVAPIHLRAERGPEIFRDRRRRLGPVREASRRVKGSRLVERAGRASIDANTAVATIGLERRGRLQLDVGDERAEH